MSNKTVPWPRKLPFSRNWCDLTRLVICQEHTVWLLPRGRLTQLAGPGHNTASSHNMAIRFVFRCGVPQLHNSECLDNPNSHYYTNENFHTWLPAIHGRSGAACPIGGVMGSVPVFLRYVPLRFRKLQKHGKVMAYIKSVQPAWLWLRLIILCRFYN